MSGKPPASAKPATAAAHAQNAAAMDSAMTEEEKLKAMLKMTDAQWKQRQEEMSHDTRINIAGQKHTKKANVPEGEPPHGYICFRCMKRGKLVSLQHTRIMLTCTGHWIQACPTNDDASYDNKIRIKKTTGIPRSMLQKVDQAELDNLDEQQRQNVMVTSEGEYVLAQADKKTWQKFQDQKNATDQAKRNVQAGDKELQELGLECPIDKRMFVDPMKTPCCGKTYCHECIENALLDNDLECPNCHTANVSLEALESDEEAKNKIKELSSKKDGGSPTASNAPSPKSDENAVTSRPGSREGTKSPGSVAGKKRTASEATETRDSLNVPAPAMKRQKSGDSVSGTPKSQTDVQQSTTPNGPANATQIDMQNMMNQMMPNMPNMNIGMGFPGMMPFMPNMPNMPNMNMNMMNPMMMGMINGMSGMPNMNGLPNMNGMPNFNAMNGNMPNNINTNMNGNHGQAFQNNNQHGNGRGGFRNNKKFNNFQKTSSPAPPQAPAGLEHAPKGPKAMTTGPPPGVPTGPAAANKFSNQQRPTGKEEDNAYMRQPVNPQRAIKGRRGMRTAEYKEL